MTRFGPSRRSASSQRTSPTIIPRVELRRRYPTFSVVNDDDDDDAAAEADDDDDDDDDDDKNDEEEDEYEEVSVSSSGSSIANPRIMHMTTNPDDATIHLYTGGWAGWQGGRAPPETA
jgi:hypothetical protein